MTRNRSLNFNVSFEALNFVKCICSSCYQVSCMNGCMEPEMWLTLSRNTMFTRAFANSQEYLTGPLDKKPARQAANELAGKV